MWNSLRFRLTTLFIGLAVIPLIAVGVILAQRTYAIESSQALALQDQVAQNAASQVDVYMQGVVTDLNSVGKEISGLNTQDPSQTLSIMLSTLSSGPYQSVYEDLALLDAQGQEKIHISHDQIVPVNQLVNQAGADEFKLPKSTRATYFSAVWPDIETGNLFITIAIPLYPARSVQLSGVLVATMRFSAIGNLLGKVSTGQGETIYMTDPHGNLIAHEDHTINLKTAHITLPTRANIQPGLNGKNVAMGLASLQIGGQTFNIIAEKPATEALSLALILISTLTIATIIALLISVTLGAFAARQIVAPIENLAASSQRIAAGDLSHTTIVNRKDEIGTLGAAFNSMTTQLRETLQGLEQRVTERTQDLEKQTLRLRTAAEVARDAASASNLNELLDRASHLIRDRFNFYHTGIFLLDENKEYAVLRASPTEAGHKMIENSHRLKVGEQGIVGRAAATGEPRIALDAGADPVHFNNPLLPETHSEMALPLKSNAGVIGVLDVQSEQPQAFTQDDIAILQVMADQLAAAIERTRLLQQVEGNLKQLEKAYTAFTDKAWNSFSSTDNQSLGYRYNNVRLEPIRDFLNDTDERSNGNSASIPIRLRGQTIGFVNVRFQGNYAPQETVNMLEQAADRLASALENARLVEETRQRSQRDAMVTEVTGRLRSTLDLETVLQTAAQELQQAFRLKEAEVRLGLPVPAETHNKFKDKPRKK